MKELRALLDEAGLVGLTVRVGVHGLAPDEPYAEACGEGIWGAGAAAQARDVAAMATSRHDSAAAALGLPSAAEVQEMRAEVERLRAVVENAGAWRAESEANEAILRAERDAAVAEVERLLDLLIACARAMAAMGVPESGPIADAFDAADAATAEVPRG